MRAIKFLGSNWSYVLWFVIYYTLAGFILGAILDNLLTGFIIVSITYGASVTLALSPAGEAILRATEGCRKPATGQEQNYLIPMFEEVYQNAKAISPKLNDGIKLYIMDAMYVNAFAIGRKTVAVTKGAMETFTADELKGILAHELGHMEYGHTKALLLAVIGNFFFSIIVWAFRTLLNIIQFISDIVAQINVLGAVFSFLTLIFRGYVNLVTFSFSNLSQIILALNSRINELQADKFAHEIGYGRELISGMYLLQKISINADVSIVERWKASHPHLADRIRSLEKLETEGA